MVTGRSDWDSFCKSKIEQLIATIHPRSL